jgi:hypothetical protein
MEIFTPNADLRNSEIIKSHQPAPPEGSGIYSSQKTTAHVTAYLSPETCNTFKEGLLENSRFPNTHVHKSL